MLILKPRATTYRETNSWLHEALMGDGVKTASGERISERNALTVADVYKCVRVKSDAFAVLPLKLRRRVAGEGIDDARDHYLWPLIHDLPNPYQTSFQWRKRIMTDLMLYGNHYSFIERRTYNGQIVALRPLVASNIRIEIGADGLPVYLAYTSGGIEVRFESSEILHLYGIGYDGICGASPIRLQMEMLGLAKAGERFGAMYFGKGSRSSVIATHPGQLGPEGRKRLRATIEDQSTTAENWHRVVVLEEGVKLEKMSIPNNEAQWTELRGFQRAEIAGMYGVPLHKIGDLTRSTNNNIEHQDLEWHRDGVMPELVNFEQEAKSKLLTKSEQDRFFFEFEFKAQMRGDTKSQTDHITSMITSTVYSPNIGKKLLGLNPVPGGDVHLVPLNMIPLHLLEDFWKAAIEGKKTPPQGGNEPQQRQIAENSVESLVKSSRVPFRNEIGRIVDKPAKDRARTIKNGLEHILLGMADAFEVPASADFAQFFDRYVTSLTKRAADWSSIDADSIATAEFERACSVLQTRKENPS